jgi:integrase
MKALDETQTARLLSAARGTRLYVPIVLAIGTGMRRGEILAVRWRDADLVKGTLSVTQSLEQTAGNLRFKAPKTAKGRRVIALPSLVVDELVRHKGEQAQQRLLLGPGYQDCGLVVARADGSPVKPDRFTQEFLDLIRNHNLPRVRFHDLRHSHASQLFKQGVHPKIVSERLGHSTIGITLDTYSHLLPGMQEEAAERFDVALRAAMGNE